MDIVAIRCTDGFTRNKVVSILFEYSVPMEYENNN